LDGPCARIARAGEDLTGLSAEMGAFFAARPFTPVEAEFDKRLRVQVYRATGGPGPLPVGWGVTVGDIAHNLRAALDGLAWQLALLKGPRPSQRTAFPVHLRATTRLRDSGGNPLPHFWNHQSGKANREIQSIDRKYWPRIEAFQPYKRGNGHRRSALYHLSELNNTDKHRLVTVINPTVGSVSWSGYARQTNFNARATLRPGTKIGHIAPVPADQEMVHLNLKTGKFEPITGYATHTLEFSSAVRFGDSCRAVKGLGVIPTLRGMIDEVSRVVDSFAREF